MLTPSVLLYNPYSAAEFYTLSLHDALPISIIAVLFHYDHHVADRRDRAGRTASPTAPAWARRCRRFIARQRYQDHQRGRGSEQRGAQLRVIHDYLQTGSVRPTPHHTPGFVAPLLHLCPNPERRHERQSRKDVTERRRARTVFRDVFS